MVRYDRKVFTNGPVAIGFTTSFRMGQLLAHSLSVPEPPADCNLHRWMVTSFVDAVRDCLKAGGYAQKDKEEERGGTFLVGIRGRLFHVSGDYQVGEPAAGFDACGCGFEIARGALAATRGRPAFDRVTTALRAAEEFSAGVRGPFYIVQKPPQRLSMVRAMAAE